MKCEKYITADETYFANRVRVEISANGGYLQKENCTLGWGGGGCEMTRANSTCVQI